MYVKWHEMWQKYYKISGALGKHSLWIAYSIFSTWDSFIEMIFPKLQVPASSFVRLSQKLIEALNGHLLVVRVELFKKL